MQEENGLDLIADQVNRVCKERENGKLLIEFFGIPGSGKSYLYRKATTHFLESGIELTPRYLDSSRIRRIQFKIHHVLRAAFRIVGIIKKISKIARNRSNVSMRETIRLNWNWLFLLAIIGNQINKGKPIALDQGLLQAYSSELFRENKGGNGAEIADLMVDLLKFLDVEEAIFIHVIVEKAAVLERLGNRAANQSPLDTNPERYSEALASDLKIKNAVLELSKRHERVHYIEIRN